jgi:hypothetical protein
MKKSIITSLFFLTILSFNLSAQEKTSSNVQATTSAEKYGKTLNIGIGLGYYGYMGGSSPAFHADFEFDVAKNFTLAPFITYYSYQNHYYWGDPYYSYRNYSYRQTVIPIGVKGSYYFDQLLNAGSKWDFYLAGSLGFAIRSTKWESGYYGQTTVNQGASALYIDLHVGTEYHMNKKTGLFLDLSSGISTFGLAVHL